MTMTERESTIWMVYKTSVFGIQMVGEMKADELHMPFKFGCYGIFGMGMVAVFGISYEVMS